MRVEVFMQSTFRERVRDVLRHLYNGIKKDLAPVDLNPQIIKTMKNFNKAKRLSNGVELNYDERGRGKYDLGVIFEVGSPTEKIYITQSDVQLQKMIKTFYVLKLNC